MGLRPTMRATFRQVPVRTVAFEALNSGVRSVIMKSTDEN